MKRTLTAIALSVGFLTVGAASAGTVKQGSTPALSFLGKPTTVFTHDLKISNTQTAHFICKEFVYGDGYDLNCKIKSIEVTPSVSKPKPSAPKA